MIASVYFASAVTSTHNFNASAAHVRLEYNSGSTYTFYKFHKALERAIIINYYSSFKDIDKHLLNNILNGITLKGAVEL